MQKCPVCETVAENENQDYCLVCTWEFEYYFDELSEEEKNIYLDRTKIFKTIYKKSTLEYIEEIQYQYSYKSFLLFFSSLLVWSVMRKVIGCFFNNIYIGAISSTFAMIYIIYFLESNFFKKKKEEILKFSSLLFFLLYSYILLLFLELLPLLLRGV